MTFHLYYIILQCENGVLLIYQNFKFDLILPPYSIYYKSSTNEERGIKMCTNSVFKVLHLTTENCRNRKKLPGKPDVHLRGHGYHYIKYIGQFVIDDIIENQGKSFPDNIVL